MGRALLADVVVAIAVATLAIQTAACRMLFSMARDGQLPVLRPPREGQPAHRHAERPRPGRRRPRRGPAAAQLRLAGGVPGHRHHLHRDAVPGLRDGHRPPAGAQRLRGDFTVEGTDETGRPLFSLGRWGVPVNALALLYGLFMTVNLAWPRAAVYDPAGGHWYFQWFTVLFLLVTLVLGGAYRVVQARRRSEAPPHAEARTAAPGRGRCVRLTR